MDVGLKEILSQNLVGLKKHVLISSRLFSYKTSWKKLCWLEQKNFLLNFLEIFEKPFPFVKLNILKINVSFSKMDSLD